MIYLHFYFQNLVDYKVICWLYYSLLHMLLMPRKTTSKVMYTLAILMGEGKWLQKVCLPLIYRKWKRNQSPQIGWCWLKTVWVVREWVLNYHCLHTSWILRSKRNTETFSLWSKKQKDKGCCQQQASCSTQPFVQLTSGRGLMQGYCNGRS